MGTTETVLAAKQLVQASSAAGVRCAFGVTGGAIGTIFDQLSASAIEVVHCQHEGSAAYAAMGRAIATRGRELPLCFATAGPGMTNLLTGVAAAYAEGVPLFVLTGNTSTQSLGMGALQDAHPGGINATPMFDSITVGNASLGDANQVVPMFQEFAARSLRYRRPVHLNVPIDISNQLVATQSVNASPEALPALKTAEQEAIGKLLAGDRPLILAGNGVKLAGCKSLLVEVAASHSIPVVVTSHGRGAFPERHECFFGTFGFASDGNARMFIESYQPDGLLVLGSGLGEMATSGWSQLVSQIEFKVHVDVDRGKFNRGYEVECTIQNDLRSVLHLASRTQARPRKLPPRPLVSGIVPRPRRQPEQSVHPAQLVSDLAPALPDNAAIFAEAGNAMAWAFRHLELRAEQELFVPLGLAAMGSGIGAALGAATASPKRPVVCLVGDCAMLMNGNELKTAVEYNINLVLIILNDSGHGMVQHGSRLIGLKNTHVRFRQAVDFAAYAQAMGATAFSVRTTADWDNFELGPLCDHQGPVLVDVRIDQSAVPPIADRAKVVGESQRPPNRWQKAGQKPQSNAG